MFNQIVAQWSNGSHLMIILSIPNKDSYYFLNIFYFSDVVATTRGERRGSESSEFINFRVFRELVY